MRPETRAARHYYAERSPYGTNTISDADTLARFDSIEERRQWLEIMDDAEPNQWRAVTLAEVRHRYDVRQFAADYHERYTQSGDRIRYIHHRPSYQL